MDDLLTELRKIEETELLELLEVTSDELVDAFLDRIEELKQKLIDYVYE
jgi:hypothetical protein